MMDVELLHHKVLLPSSSFLQSSKAVLSLFCTCSNYWLSFYFVYSGTVGMMKSVSRSYHARIIASLARQYTAQDPLCSRHDYHIPTRPLTRCGKEMLHDSEERDFANDDGTHPYGNLTRLELGSSCESNLFCSCNVSCASVSLLQDGHSKP